MANEISCRFTTTAYSYCIAGSFRSFRGREANHEIVTHEISKSLWIRLATPINTKRTYTWTLRFALSQSLRCTSTVNCSCIVISRSCSCQCLLKPSHDSPSAVRSRKFFLERDLQSLLISPPRRQKDRGVTGFPLAW